VGPGRDQVIWTDEGKQTIIGGEGLAVAAPSPG